MPVDMLDLSLLSFHYHFVAKQGEKVDRLICTSIARIQYLCFTVLSKNLTYLQVYFGKWLEGNVNLISVNIGLPQECVLSA